MPRTLILALFLLLNACTKAQSFFMPAVTTPTTTSAATTTPDGRQAFVIIGNSIASGTETAGGKGPAPAAGTVFEFNGTSIVEVGANDLSTSNSGSQWPRFGIDYYNITGLKPVFINTASGGAEFYPNNDNNNWYTTGTLYAAMQTKVANGLAALGVTKPAAILIELGINDARGAKTLTSIQEAVSSLSSRLTVSFPDVPVYYTYPGRMETAISNGRIDLVRSYISSTVTSYSSTHSIAFDLRTFATDHPEYYGTDSLHLNQAGNNAYGAALAAAVATGQGAVPDATLQTLAQDGRYNAFGTFVTISATKKMYIFRSGTDHIQGGRIDAIDYNVLTNRYYNRRTLYTPPAGYDPRDPRVSLINGKIFIFTSLTDLSIGKTYQMGYLKSTDATGTSWSAFTPLEKTMQIALPWGKAVAGDVAGTWFQPFYESDFVSGGTWKEGLWKTTDYGETWTAQYMYIGTRPLTETAVVNLGGGKMLSLSRLELSYGFTSNGLWQMTSSDGGTTWSAPVVTNLGGTSINIPALYYNAATGKITCVYQNRASGNIEYSANNTATTVFASPTGWINELSYYDNYDEASGLSRKGLGYPDYDGENLIWNRESAPGGVEQAWLLTIKETFGN